MREVNTKCNCHKLFRSSFGSEKHEGDGLGYGIMDFAIHCYQKNEDREWKQELWCDNLMKMGTATRCQKIDCEGG
jgi:hypothetical protein